MADSSNPGEGSSGQAAKSQTTAVAAAASGAGTNAPYPLPRVTIRFCTQCKWMLRAAYFAQELLSTFSTALGEVALQPSTGGTFVVEISFQDPSSSSSSSSSSDDTPPAVATIQRRVLWDRKVDGGFPETKELKRRVRDAIEPGRNLGHVDRDYGHNSKTSTATAPAPASDGKLTEASGMTQTPQQAATAEVAGQPEATTTQAAGEVCEDCR